MEQHYQYWADLAAYDLETAKAMLKTRRFLYVGFMCHQAVEKMLKAYYCQSQKSMPPYTHNLKRLAQESGLTPYLSKEHFGLLDLLGPLNIETRYPQDKNRLSKDLNAKSCKKIVVETRSLVEWIKKKSSDL